MKALRGVLALALMCWPGLATGAAPAAEDLERRRDALDFGLWNRRINALYDAAELGQDALPLLVYASDDADWQVRLTVAHFMGKLGPAAAPALGELARVDPCPRVRVSAMRWLKGMGPAGRAILAEVMSPEDEREMEMLPDRFGTERMGKPIAIDPPGGEMTPAFFDNGLDLRTCASSEHANRRRRGLAVAPEREDAAAPEIDEAVSTPPVGSARERERLPDAPPSAAVALVEPDVPRARKLPETLPPGGPGLGPRERAAPEASFAASPERTLSPVPPRAPLPPAESLPAAGPGIGRAAAEPGAAGFVDDAGVGKPENDPIPELIKRLASSEPRTRARAADELGKRGRAALPAAPALRRALKDRDRRVRASAVLALGGVAGSQDGVVDDLRRALRDKNEDVRFSAVIALERLASPEKK